MKKLSQRANDKFRLDPGKAKCQGWHAAKRAKERTGIRLTEQLSKEIVSCIKKNKEHNDFKLSFVESQSKRLSVYEIVFTGKNPVNLVYDNFRNTIVTFLYPEDAFNVYHFYDVFGNKVSVKNEYGKIWKLKDNVLDIPGETVEYADGVWTVIEGVLKDKRFKIDKTGCLQEIF